MNKIYVGVGHGGSDPGAVSGKHREAAYALDIATACTAELKRHGVSVMQSRLIDETESAAAKVKECNIYDPDLALDIHLNAGKGDGFEAFHSINGGKGKTLAEKIEAAVKKIGQNSRGVKTKLNRIGKDYFGIIRQTACPAVLVECAFIDSKDVEIIDTRVEREMMGIAIAHGILAYLGIEIKAMVVDSGASSGASASGSGYTLKQFIKDVQKACGAAVDGIAGKETLDKTVTVSATKNRKHAVVKPIQKRLNALGYKCGTADGIAGTKFTAAVKKFQKANGCTADGEITARRKTWQKLLAIK